MKVKYKLPLSFIVVASLVWIVGLSAIIVSKSNLESTIAQYSTASLHRITHYVDKEIYSKVEYFLGRTHGAMIQNEVSKSNHEISQKSNPYDFIISRDKEWRKLSTDSTNQLMDLLSSNELTRSLKAEMRVFEKLYKFPIFSEILVTDSLGALVAQTDKATDYYQADEPWWQKTKNDGLYLTEFIFDESSKTFGMEICIKISDRRNRFIGVLKAVVGLENLLNSVRDYLEQDTITNRSDANYIIFDKEGKIFLSSHNYKFLDKYPRFEEIRENLSRGEQQFKYSSPGNGEFLAFFRPLTGYRDFMGFGWVLVAEYHEPVIYSEIYALRNQIIVSCIVITALGIIISLLISIRIIRPIKSLLIATKKISQGNHDFTLDTTSPDEIGDLSRSFKEMSDKVNEYNSKLLMQTEELSQINLNLQQEITERKNVQNSLAQEKEKIAITLKSISDSVIATDNNGKIILMNSAAELLTGVEAENAYGKLIEEVFKIVERPEWNFMEILKDAKIFEHKKTYTEQVTLKNSLGKEITILNSIAPIIDSAETYSGLVLVSRDVTEKSLIEKQLVESEKKFRNLFNNSVLGIFRSSIEGRFLDVNPAFAKMFRYDSPKEIVECITDIKTQIYSDQDDRDRILEQLINGRGYGVFETKFRAKDNSILIGSIHIRIEKDFSGNILFLEGFVEDITERKTAEENFYKIFNSSPEWIAISTIEDGTVVIANQSYYEAFEYTPAETIGKTAQELNLWVEYEYRKKVVDVVIEDGTLKNVEVKLKAKSGRILICLVSFERIIFSGSPHLITIGRDITERKEWEDSLANEKERLSVTLRSIGDGVITTDVDGKVTLLNRVAEKLTGYTQQEAHGKFLEDIFRIFDADSGIKRENPFTKVISTNVIIELESNTKLIAKDGTERMIADSGSPIRDKNSQVIGMALVFRDITQKRKIEQELQKIQKIESIGVLAGGLAHDFNNILTSIVGSISLALLKPDSEHKDKYLRLAENAALRAKDLTQQLLTFSRGGDPIKKLTSLENIVRMSASFASSGSNSEISFDCEKDLWKTEVDEGQISQVINNIVLNAIQAMPNGGKVSIKLQNYSASLKDEIIPHGNYALIRISDTGEGIDPNVIKKIFDPYFTTKQKGSGLGLAISYSIISKHHGFIDVISRPGKGTEFLIYLPASENKTLPLEPSPEKINRGKGNVLVMDDEEAIREIMKDILNMLGYNVITANDGAEAIEKYNKAIDTDGSIDLVIMDLTIPGGMGGKETITKLLKINPGVKAIVSSGYSNDPVMADFKKHGFKGTIAKPYRVDEVGKIVNMVINQK